MHFARDLLQLPIRFDAEALAADIVSLPEAAWVPHPMAFPGNDAVPLVSVNGGLNDEFNGPMAATEHLARLPYIAGLMEELGGVWGRGRLMGLGAGAVVPRHVDIHYYWRTHIRIHVPVITNPGVRFLCGNEEEHMRPGEAWVFNSFKLHEVRNEGSEKRIHLVLDTVGSDRIRRLIEQANANAPIPDHAWRPAHPTPPDLHFERVNHSTVMSPWEMRCHADFLLEHAVGEPGEEVRDAIDRFIFRWQAAWTEHGEDETGWPIYRELVRAGRRELTQAGATEVILDNGAPLSRGLDALVLGRALILANAQSRANVAPSPKAA
jgi:hypothetical protein